MTDPTNSADDEIPEPDDSFELASPSMTQTTAEADETNVPGQSDLDESPSLEHDGEDNEPVSLPPRRPSEPIPLIFNPRARGNDYHGVKRFLVFASGARPEILAQCPTDEATHVGLGGTVVATSFLSGISMIFAMRDAMNLSLFSAFFAGLLWAAIIFNLDRWLIVSQKRTATAAKQWLNVLPRVLVAVLLGFVISEPLLHALFKPELQREIATLQAEQSREAREEINNGSQASQIEDNKAELTDLELTNAADSPAEKSLQDEITKLQAETNAARQKYDTAQSEVTKEEQGLSITGRAGCGPVCIVLTQDRDVAQRAYEEVEDRNGTRIKNLQDQIDQSRLRTAGEREQRLAENQARREQLIADNINLSKEMDAAIAKINDADEAGLLLNIEALGTLSSKNTSVAVARWLIFALFIALDTIPVIGKTLILTGPRRPYEQACDAIDSRLTQDAEQVVAEARIDRDEHIDLLEKDAKLRVKVQSQNNEHFIRNAAKTQRDIGDLLLDRWRAEQISRVQQEINKQTPGDA